MKLVTPKVAGPSPRAKHFASLKTLFCCTLLFFFLSLSLTKKRNFFDATPHTQRENCSQRNWRPKIEAQKKIASNVNARRKKPKKRKLNIQRCVCVVVCVKSFPCKKRVRHQVYIWRGVAQQKKRRNNKKRNKFQQTFFFFFLATNQPKKFTTQRELMWAHHLAWKKSPTNGFNDIVEWRTRNKKQFHLNGQTNSWPFFSRPNLNVSVFCFSLPAWKK